MLKTILFNLLFICTFSTIALANGEVVDNDDFGKEKPKKNSLSGKSYDKAYSFSLRSDMTFKGENLLGTKFNNNNFLKAERNSISFTKEANQNYLLPNKKKAILNKLTFNPNELLRNYSGR